ncbi:MAG: exodeoxyribonuclease VII small subunit [Propionibacteriaceae bacterium]|jgi:exodeoxyribonuclease VII small subunit|nr:exodeoxyribonuclease VII small subunit [Propionibacteriaceae bacterium]
MASPKTTEAATPADDQAQLTYEQAREELISVVNRLESGGESLADSMRLFSRGEELAALCERYLDDARATVEASRDAQPDAS